MSLNGTARSTVLVVDDSEDTRFMLRRMLEVRDYCVVEATDGTTAVEIVRRSYPDLILMDLDIPHMDGLAAAKRIRERKEPCEGVPIVALTGHPTYGMKEAALEAGFDDYLVKPIDFD